VPYVFEIMRRLRLALAPAQVPLIGFAGAPFTLATYLMEGQGDPTRSYPNLRRSMCEEPALVEALLERLAEMTVAYLNAQIDAGAQVVQLFDTWAGVLDADAYERWLLPVTQAIAAGVKQTGVPLILYLNDAPHLFDLTMESGADVLSIGAAVEIADAARRAGRRVSLQGNLDPHELALGRAHVFARVREIAEAARPARGLILNLGHGCLPDTPVEGVRAFTDAARAGPVRTSSADRRGAAGLGAGATLSAAGRSVLVLDASARAGGVMQSERIDGWSTRFQPPAAHPPQLAA
jgi:uroporphyrinogen decarboxylase